MDYNFPIGFLETSQQHKSINKQWNICGLHHFVYQFGYRKYNHWQPLRELRQGHVFSFRLCSETRNTPKVILGQPGHAAAFFGRAISLVLAKRQNRMQASCHLFACLRFKVKIVTQEISSS